MEALWWIGNNGAALYYWNWCGAEKATALVRLSRRVNNMNLWPESSPPAVLLLLYGVAKLYLFEPANMFARQRRLFLSFCFLSRPLRKCENISDGTCFHWRFRPISTGIVWLRIAAKAKQSEWIRIACALGLLLFIKQREDGSKCQSHLKTPINFNFSHKSLPKALRHIWSVIHSSLPINSFDFSFTFESCIRKMFAILHTTHTAQFSPIQKFFLASRLFLSSFSPSLSCLNVEWKTFLWIKYSKAKPTKDEENW